jgi:hypothetical protein
MHLIEVAPDKTKMVPGYEQHTFECSSCHEQVRQLVFIPRAIGPLNSEETRLSTAWLETLNKGMTPPKGDDVAPAVRAVPPIKAMYVKAMYFKAMYVVGMQAHRAQHPAFGSFAQTAMRRPAACNAVRTRCF